MFSRRALAGALFAGIASAAIACSGSVPRETPVPEPTATPTAEVLPTATARAGVTVPTATPGAVSTPTQTPTPPLVIVEGELSLTILGPQSGQTVQADAIVVHGNASPGSVVRIAGTIVTSDQNGDFQTEVALTPGVNVIEVVATGGDGGTVSQSLSITALAPQPFQLLITEPKDQSIVRENPLRIFGRSSPDAVVSVDGVSVTVDAIGIFSTMVLLDDGPNVIDVVATNNDGRILSSVLAVIFRR